MKANSHSGALSKFIRQKKQRLPKFFMTVLYLVFN